MSFWKKTLWKTDLWQKILLRLAHWEESLRERIYWTRTRWKRKSPQQIREIKQFASARLQEVLPLTQRNYWDFPEGYVPVVPVVRVPSPSSPAPIPADSQFESGDLQFEASDSQFEARELQPEVRDLQFESGDLQFEAVDMQAGASELQPETVDLQSEVSVSQPEAGDLQPEVADRPFEAGEREPEDPAQLADEMAANFYGFGDWTAPYWFIGLEPGKAQAEEADNSNNVRAWANGLKKGELVDCREYYRAIGVDEWHNERARLQATWRPLMLFLMTALDRDAGKEALRAYQRTRWGQMEDGETCVIELSGIPAKSLAVETDRKKYLEQRIGAIQEKINWHKPKVVLMYGLTARSAWKDIAGAPLERDTVVEVGSTLFVMTPSPTARGRKNADWESLGLEVRERLSSR